MKKWIKWVFVILWMAFIFMFSNESGIQSTHSSQFWVSTLNHYVQIFLPNLSIATMTLFIRKGAHIFLYFVLGILVSNAVENSKWLFYTILICLLYACTDEIHQLFIIGRSGNIYDVFIDMIGSSFGIMIYNIIVKHSKKIA